MKLSDMMTPQEWQTVLDAAGGHVEKARAMAAIGWHETHFGRLGWGRYGYHLGVGAYSPTNAAPEYQGLDRQLEWTSDRLWEADTYTLADMLRYGREIQRPADPDQWGKSVHSIYQSLVVDYDTPRPVEAGPGTEIAAPQVAGLDEAMQTVWARCIIGGLLLFALLMGGRRTD